MWQREPLGYVASARLLFIYNMLLLGPIPILALSAFVQSSVGSLGMTNSTVFVASFFFIVLSFSLILLTGMAHDIQADDQR